MFTQAKLTKTPQEKLIEWLEKEEFTEQANSLRTGGTILSLGRIRIEDAGARVLAEALKTNTALTSAYSWTWSRSHR